MVTIAIPGAGGLSQACELRQALGAQYKIAVINGTDYFGFTRSNS